MQLIKFGALAASMAIVGAAHAFDLGADWNFYLGRGVDYETNIGGWTGPATTNTALIQGSRSVGAAGGTTTLMPFAPNIFDTYCVEIGQTISGGYQTHATVSALLGSSTNTGGFAGPILFDAVRTRNLQTLWGSFKGLVVDDVDSAAFQLAQWEITFDDNLTLDAGSRFWSGSSDAYRVKAESWLTAIRTGSATTQQQLLLLSGDNIQDLVTPVPEPATMACLGLGALAMLRRRRSK